MNKLGRYNLIQENVCKLDCGCGWNIQIGGKDPDDLERIKDYLKRGLDQDSYEVGYLAASSRGKK